MIKIDWYQISLSEDEDDIDLTIKSPSFSSYSNLVMNNTFDNRLLFLQENIIKPDKDTVLLFFNKYPALIDELVEEMGNTFDKHIKDLNESVNKKWKEYEKNYLLSGRALLSLFDKPVTEDNLALTYLLLDGVACLRHLRLAYSKKG